MNWKFDFSPETSDIFAVGGGAVDLSVGRWWYPVGLDVANFAKPVARILEGLGVVCAGVAAKRAETSALVSRYI
jgi:hypothetical protein